MTWIFIGVFNSKTVLEIMTKPFQKILNITFFLTPCIVSVYNIYYTGWKELFCKNVINVSLNLVNLVFLIKKDPSINLCRMPLDISLLRIFLISRYHLSKDKSCREIHCLSLWKCAKRGGGIKSKVALGPLDQ